MDPCDVTLAVTAEAGLCLKSLVTSCPFPHPASCFRHLHHAITPNTNTVARCLISHRFTPPAPNGRWLSGTYINSGSMASHYRRVGTAVLHHIAILTARQNTTPWTGPVLILVRSRTHPAPRPVPAGSSSAGRADCASPHPRSRLPFAPDHGYHLPVACVICLVMTSGW